MGGSFSVKQHSSVDLESGWRSNGKQVLQFVGGSKGMRCVRHHPPFRVTWSRTGQWDESDWPLRADNLRLNCADSGIITCIDDILDTLHIEQLLQSTTTVHTNCMYYAMSNWSGFSLMNLLIPSCTRVRICYHRRQIIYELTFRIISRKRNFSFKIL